MPNENNNDRPNPNQDLLPVQAGFLQRLGTLVRKARQLTKHKLELYIFKSFEKLKEEAIHNPQSIIENFFDDYFIPAMRKHHRSVLDEIALGRNQNNNNNNNNNLPVLPRKYREILQTPSDDDEQYNALFDLVKTGADQALDEILFIESDAEGSEHLRSRPPLMMMMMNPQPKPPVEAFKAFCQEKFFTDEIKVSIWESKNNFDAAIVEKILMRFLHATGCALLHEHEMNNADHQRPHQVAVPVVPERELNEYIFYLPAETCNTTIRNVDNFLSQCSPAVQDHNVQLAMNITAANAEENLKILKKASPLVCDAGTWVFPKKKVTLEKQTNLLDTTRGHHHVANEVVDILKKLSAFNQDFNNNWKLIKNSVATALVDYLKAPGTRKDLKSLLEDYIPKDTPTPKKSKAATTRNTAGTLDDGPSTLSNKELIIQDRQGRIGSLLTEVLNTTNLMSRNFIDVRDLMRNLRGISVDDPGNQNDIQEEQDLREQHYSDMYLNCITRSVSTMIQCQPSLFEPFDEELSEKCNNDWKNLALLVTHNRDITVNVLKTYCTIMSKFMGKPRDDIELSAQLKALKQLLPGGFRWEQIQRRGREEDDGNDNDSDSDDSDGDGPQPAPANDAKNKNKNKSTKKTSPKKK